MAPTEILAEQHYINIRRLLERRASGRCSPGATPAKARRERLQAELAGGSMHMVVGTHALIEEAVGSASWAWSSSTSSTGSASCSARRCERRGLHPDVLVMTATPIPRTLALTAYGDLDTSVIREMPPGRHPIKTTVRPENARDEIYEFIRRSSTRGARPTSSIRWSRSRRRSICERRPRWPTISRRTCSRRIASRCCTADEAGRQGSGHGAFARGESHVLVATTVVEVGVDVPNASVMVVEHAERFGLSQLHQLRGRVGRGPHQSHCILVYQSPLSDEAARAPQGDDRTSDGFEIAERDLQLRGPGDFFGTRQSGLPTLRVGDLLRDHQLMEEARREAVAALDDPAQCASLRRWSTSWEQRFGLVGIG